MDSPADVYRERSERFARLRDAVTVRWERVANARLVVFVLALAAFVWGIFVDDGWTFALLGFALLLGYGMLATYHGILGRRRQRLIDLVAINEEAVQRHNRAWDELPLRAEAPADAGHPYALDLDITGRASLLHLLLASPTAGGERTLRRWLLAPAPTEAVRERQGAVAELADALDLRDDLAVGGRRVRAARPDPEPFLAWAEAEPWLSRYRAILWVARISPIALFVLLVAQIADIVALPLWLPFLGANVVLYLRLGGRSYRTLSSIWQQSDAFGEYAEMFLLVTDARLHAPSLRRIQETLSADGRAASRQMRRLDRLAALNIPRSAILYWPIQFVTLWDLHALAALEGWQGVAGGRARGWLAALGEVEALAALAALRYDNPDWAFPESDASARLVRARGLGHPLLPPAERVDNDIEVGPAGTFLLVTGSNMSGKSTLLRAIGVNLVLAGAGAPVCAAWFRAPPVTLWTSMRVQDSLERGVSYFMAELIRLKAVVDAASREQGTRNREQGGLGNQESGLRTSAAPALFYLLDEILQGTNTAERQIAARRIVAHLIDQGALGAVSTHDLTLADAPELAARRQA
jgi:predicted ATPase